jgi:TPR repeat protein
MRFNYGRLLAKGDNIQKNEVRGAEFLTRGCDGGEPLACVELAEAYKKGRGVQESLPKSEEMLDKACTLGWRDKRCRK